MICCTSKNDILCLLLSVLSDFSVGLGGGVFILNDTPLDVFESYSLTSAAYLSSVKH